MIFVFCRVSYIKSRAGSLSGPLKYYTVSNYTSSNKFFIQRFILRINKKLFCLSGNKYENPPPGSVLDHTIMKKTFDDFLLVSQHVNQVTYE